MSKGMVERRVGRREGWSRGSLYETVIEEELSGRSVESFLNREKLNLNNKGNIGNEKKLTGNRRNKENEIIRNDGRSRIRRGGCEEKMSLFVKRSLLSLKQKKNDKNKFYFAI